MVWSFDPSIHKRLERINSGKVTRSNPCKQSICNDRSTGTEQSANHDDHFPISDGEIAHRRAWVWYDCQWRPSKYTRDGSQTLSQLPCDVGKTCKYNVYYPWRFVVSQTHALLSLMSEGIRIWAHCHCRNVHTNVEIGHSLPLRSVLLNQIFSTHLLILVTQPD